jgi:hypothetical protein
LHNRGKAISDAEPDVSWTRHTLAKNSTVKIGKPRTAAGSATIDTKK